jgi:hypothetical protein
MSLHLGCDLISQGLMVACCLLDAYQLGKVCCADPVVQTVGDEAMRRGHRVTGHRLLCEPPLPPDLPAGDAAWLDVYLAVAPALQRRQPTQSAAR